MSRGKLLALASQALGVSVQLHHLEYLVRKGYVTKPTVKIGNALLYDHSHLNQLLEAVRKHSKLLGEVSN